MFIVSCMRLSRITSGSSGSMLEFGLYICLSVLDGWSPSNVFYTLNLLKVSFIHILVRRNLQRLYPLDRARCVSPGTRTRTRVIPQGYRFNLVSFPDYSFETVDWVVISVMTGSVGGSFVLLLVCEPLSSDWLWCLLFCCSVDLYHRHWSHYVHAVD